MRYIHFVGQNLRLGASKDWDEAKHGPCGTLPARVNADRCCIESYWKPTDEELALLMKGGAVCLGVHSMSHPPVSMHVEMVQEKYPSSNMEN